VLGAVLTAGAYLLGSINFALLAAKKKGVDLREQGSGNPGATNAGRVLGKKIGRAVLALDAAKGALPAAAARASFGAEDPWTAATGFAAVLGHCYPLWHRFDGGKGAATAAGVLLVLAPPAGVAAGATYAIVKKASGRASAGSIAGALVGAGTAAAVYGAHSPRAWMASGLLVLILLRHKENLGRLARGEEPRS
jgi:acyl phosphate:glycerol-3-phosphate acyltransferase